jgi:hypothetical protein
MAHPGNSGVIGDGVIVDCRLQIDDWRIVDWRLADCRLSIANPGMRIDDGQLSISQSPIANETNRQSAISNRHSDILARASGDSGGGSVSKSSMAP